MTASVPPPPEGAPHHPPRLARPDAVPRLKEPAVALPTPDGVAEFWADVRRRGTPLVSPDPLGSADHRAVTFLWRSGPATRAVQVLPNKLGVAHRPPVTPLRHPGVAGLRRPRRAGRVYDGVRDRHRYLRPVTAGGRPDPGRTRAARRGVRRGRPAAAAR
jgi:enterochelin esterase family protein